MLNLAFYTDAAAPKKNEALHFFDTLIGKIGSSNTRVPVFSVKILTGYFGYNQI